MRLFFLVAWFLIFLFRPAFVFGQMPVTVSPDRIGIGAEFVPRGLDQPGAFQVVSGAVAVLNAGTYGTVEVGGTLMIPPVEVKVETLTVLPGATLVVDCGATIIGRDTPIDLASDPFQWGHGFLNFGTLVMLCPDKTPFVAIEPALAGATHLTLAEAPTGWAVGDAVMLPDSRPMKTGAERVKQFPVREPNATITAISGTSLTITPPLAFARPAVVRPDGSVVVTPRVVNLSRRTVVRSENPAGTRWHIANVGHDAAWDVKGVALVGLARTKNLPLDAVTNHIGRYVFHVHHAGHSTSVRRFRENAIIGIGNGKWGAVLHQTDHAEVTGNVCVDLPSGCFVTEDGNETGNVFRGNLAAFATGNNITAQNNVKAGCPGCESAYWFRGVGNILDANEAWNSQVGFNLFNQARVAFAGEAVPLVMTDNVAVSNAHHGMEYWSVRPFPNDRYIGAYNGRLAVWNAFPEREGYVELVDAILLGANGETRGIESAQGYAHGIEMLRGEVRGFNAGIFGGIGKVHGRFTETVFQNVVNFPFSQRFTWPRELPFTRVLHEPLPGHPLRYLDSVAALAWSGVGPFPSDVSPWTRFDVGTFVLTDWQGTGENYRVAYPSQVSTALAWPTRGPNDWQLPPPECGATIGETWTTCGMTFGGETFPPGTETFLPGLVNLVAISTDPPTLGVPKAIMTTPNSAGAFTNPMQSNGQIFLNFVLTGDMTKANTLAYFSIDGGFRTASNYRRGGPSSVHYVGRAVSVTTPGVHVVRTWRELNSMEVAGSSMTFQYVIP